MLSKEDKQALLKLPTETLVDFVQDIYGLDKLISKKIDRLILQADTSKLVKKLTTTLKGLKRRRKFVDYWESRDFAKELEFLRSDVMSLYPQDSLECLELLELFMSSTNNSLERCDDSDGYVGDVYRQLSTDWLEVAATCYALQKQSASLEEQDLLSQFWVKKFKNIVSDNTYCTKDDLYLDVNKLFSDKEIRSLIKDFEEQYEAVQSKINSMAKKELKLGSKHVTLYKKDEALSLEKFILEHTVEYLAKALGDVELYERIFIRNHPKQLHNPMVLEKLIEVLLENKAYDKAIVYLDKYWSKDAKQYQLKKLDWLNEIYEKQGDVKSQLAVLEKALAIESSPKRLNRIMDLVSPAEQSIWRNKALELAKQEESVDIAISLLLDINKMDLANEVAVARHNEFKDYRYDSLINFLKTLPEDAKLIKIIVYRSLLNDILNNSRKKAYGIAARYFKKLQLLDAQVYKLGLNYQGMQTHQEYVTALVDKHGKKRSFWEKVDD